MPRYSFSHLPVIFSLRVDRAASTRGRFSRVGNDIVTVLKRAERQETGRRPAGEQLISKKHDKRLVVYPGLASWTNPSRVVTGMQHGATVIYGDF